MLDGSPHDSSLAQVLATVYTCRSIITYNLALNDGQRTKILADIDYASRLLQEHIASASSQSSVPSTKPPPVGHLPFAGTNQLLYALYRVHSACLGDGQKKKINGFIDRFNKVTAILDEVQATLEERQALYFDTQPVESHLHYVSDFVVDLYYVFVELARALSAVLQGKEFHAETEELASMQQPLSMEKQPLEEQNSLDLLGVYEIYPQLAESRRILTKRVADTIPFLEFLEEGFEAEGSRREKIVAQLDEAVGLLKELLLLISNYESVISTWLHPT